MPDSKDIVIAAFISPHGFGHAARTTAIMAALRELDETIRFEIFTTVTPDFFRLSLGNAFNYHRVVTDVGLVQLSPLRHDLPATLERLDALLPLAEPGIERLARQLRHHRCALVLCDIAPLGIAAARAAGLPSVLIENFTWDWIYRDYVDAAPGLGRHIDYLARVFHSADYHIKTAPVCEPGDSDLLTAPISRKPRQPAHLIRSALEVPEGSKMVLISMGGVKNDYRSLDRLNDFPQTCFVVPGAAETPRVDGNRVLLPHHSDFYHPDLVNAADAIIGKIGYSTLAEVYHAGIPFGYIPRPSFPETEVLTTYVRTHCNGFAITAAAFEDCRWPGHVADLLRLPRLRRNTPNGASRAARFIQGVLNGLSVWRLP